MIFPLIFENLHSPSPPFLRPHSTWRLWGPAAPVLSHTSLVSKRDSSQAECPLLQQRLPLAWGSTRRRGQCPPWQLPPAGPRPYWQACLPLAWALRPCSSPPPSIIAAFYVSSEPPLCPCPAASPPPLLPLLPPPPLPLHPPPRLLPHLPPLQPLWAPLPPLLRLSSPVVVAPASTAARRVAWSMRIRTSPPATLDDEEEDEDIGEFKHHNIMKYEEKMTTLWKIPSFSLWTFWLLFLFTFLLQFWLHSNLQNLHISMARTTVL